MVVGVGLVWKLFFRLQKFVLNHLGTLNHSWYSNIINCLDKNGLNYISENPCSYTEDHIINQFKQKLEDQYLQAWDNKALSNKIWKRYIKLKKSINVVIT